MARWCNRGRAWPVQALLWVCGYAVSLGCGRSDSSTVPASKGSTTAVMEFGPQHLRTAPTAFDLAFDGALGALGWVESADTLSLWLARFDARGELLGKPERRPIATAVEDLSLVMAGAQPLLVWRARSAGSAVGRGLLAGTGGDVPMDLGAVWAGGGAERGNLALAVRQGGALALIRGPEESCGDGSVEACFGFRFYQLSSMGAREREFPLRVPVPCAAQAAQLIPAGSAVELPGAPALPLQYAVCTRAESLPVLTVFSIEPDRSYAAAHRILEGCTPLGAGVFAGYSSFVGDCHGSRQLVRVRGGDAPPEPHSLDVRGLVCSASGPRLRLGEEWLALDRPIEHLELLLDTELSPPGARALWTGQVLLVARELAGQLEIGRYGCVGSELRKLASPLADG